MARTFPTPVCTASPAWGGTASYTIGAHGSLNNTADYKDEYQNYTYTATRAQGYTFVRFVVTVEYYDAGAYGTRTSNYYGTASGASWVYDADATVNIDWTRAGYGFWYGYYSDGQLIPGFEGYVTSISVVAEFAPEHQHTHLLVSSSGNPAQLVYDPATDLLVADY